MNDGNTSGSGASDAPQRRQGEIGTGQQPCQRHADGDRRQRHQDGELHRSPRRRQRLGEHLAAVPAEGERPPGDVQHRGGEGHGDGDADEVEGDRRAARFGWRVDRLDVQDRLVACRVIELCCRRLDRRDVVHSALESGVADHVPRRLEVGAEVVEVEVDVARRGEVDVGQDVGWFARPWRGGTRTSRR